MIDPIIFNWAVYLQLPIWIFFYHANGEKWERLDTPFFLSWMGLLAFFLSLGLFLGVWSINQYPIPLILFYGLELMAVYRLLKDWPFPKRISMAFLLTFFSSWFWEMPIHLASLVINGLTLTWILQAVRILPVAFFIGIYRIVDRKALINWILTAGMITLAITLLEMDGTVGPFYVGILRSIPIPGRFFSSWVFNPNVILWTYLIRISNFSILCYIFLSGRILRLRREIKIERDRLYCGPG